MKISHIKIKLIVVLLTGFVSACNLEKEVGINLPEYEIQPVLECYLEPDKPFRLLLTKSNSYFDPFPSEENLLEFFEKTLISNADIKIKYDNTEVILGNDLIFDPLSFKAYNYTSNQLVPKDYAGDFQLEAVLADGTTIFGLCKILPVIPIDSLAVEFNSDSLARTLIYLNDPQGEANYYRRLLNFGNLRDSFPEQDFVTDDQFAQNGRIAFGHGFSLEKGDTVYNTIFHIDKAYFEFLNSVNNSVLSNGNPFIQPGVIITNLTGTANAIGIFTGLTYDRKMTIIQ